MKLWQKIVIKSLQQYWRHSRGLMLGVQALVLDDEKRVLLTRTPDGEWRLPGGDVRLGESAEAALARVLSQELGLAATSPPELLGIEHVTKDTVDHHVTRFAVAAWQRVDEARAEHAFFHADAIPDMRT